MEASERPQRYHRKGRTLGRKIAMNWQLYVLLVIPTSFLVLFNYLPMLGAQIAFRNFNPIDGIWHSPWVGFDQFNQFLNSPYFWPILKNTLRISLYSLGVGIPCAIILAIAINEVKHVRFKKLVQLATYAPYFISTVVMVGILQIILNPSTGLFGQFGHALDIKNPYDMLGSPGAFPSVYVWSGVWQETGYAAVIYLAALSGVNPELYEAAKIDGATRIRKIYHIDLPSLIPTFTVLLILGVGGVLSVGFEKVFLMQNMLNISSSEIISTYVYKVGLIDTNYSFGVAVGLFNSVVGLILILIVNTVARKISNASLF
ncbi:ABC transporter permease [Paenibacillus glycanilyticus]|uniref:ABC transporter permease n=1 Tax=Paenibacillus glycanilyticus TaxID=126569 RepID=UPI0024E0654B|nr:ABC transporter permease subunit [Paenibacillus glycanilyticus]